jgi:hypothetical protein
MSLPHFSYAQHATQVTAHRWLYPLRPLTARGFPLFR